VRSFSSGWELQFATDQAGASIELAPA